MSGEELRAAELRAAAERWDLLDKDGHYIEDGTDLVHRGELVVWFRHTEHRGWACDVTSPSHGSYHNTAEEAIAKYYEVTGRGKVTKEVEAAPLKPDPATPAEIVEVDSEALDAALQTLRALSLNARTTAAAVEDVATTIACIEKMSRQETNQHTLRSGLNEQVRLPNSAAERALEEAKAHYTREVVDVLEAFVERLESSAADLRGLLK